MSKTANQPIPAEGIQAGLFWSYTFDFAERQWKIVFSPSDFYYKNKKTWQAWGVLFGSLLLTTILALYMFKKALYTSEIELRINKQLQTTQQLENEIRERKHKQEALRESEEKYRQLFETAMVGIYRTRLEDGKFLEANQTLAKMLGYESVDRLVDEYITSTRYKDPELRKELLNRLRSHGRVDGFEIEMMRNDGSAIHIALSATAYPDKGYLEGFIVDITDRKEAERLLEFTQFTVHQAKIAVFWCHADGFFFYINDTACKWLQYSREELMTMHVADINPEFPREAWDDHWNEIKKHGLVQIQSVHRRKNGEIYPVEIFSNYVKYRDKEYKLAFVHDISIQKQAEEEKTSLEERLRQSQKMEAIGTLAGGVAHDLNNMLSPILGYTQLLQLELQMEDDRWIKLNEINKAGLRARDLIQKLLMFARKQPLSIQPLDLNSVIVGLEKMLRRTIREDIQIKKKLGTELPAIEGDSGQIEQILLNLAVNSQDAMPDGGVITIETSLKRVDEEFQEFGNDSRPGTYIMMSVSDTGHGMSEKTLTRIFEPFYTTKGKGMGTGLGLSTVYGIVKQHDGIIWTYSEPGQGTTFKILLPQSEKTIEADERADRSATLLHGTEIILVVEDQTMVLDLSKSILERCGYRVLGANNAQKALGLAKNTEPQIDLLLTDVVMPDLNGRELFEKMVVLLPDLKVVYMSGYTDDIIVHHGVVDKDVSFISKPFSVDELSRRIRKELDG